MAQTKHPRKQTSRKRKANHGFFKTLATVIAAIAVLLILYFVCFSFLESRAVAFEPTETPIGCENNELLKVIAPQALDEEFIEYKGFYVSFNPTFRIPNYVAYELTVQEAQGDEARAKSFRRDDNIERCPDPSEYTRSGYDRGHMAPAADMKWDYDAMRESFYMTNICPQKHALNGGGWKYLEEKIRDWAVRDSALIVITGPILSNDMPTIGNGIAVPKQFFKVVLAHFAKPIRGIGFLYKNEGGQKKVAQQAVPIDSIEDLTGYDFFSMLPDEIENCIEASSNYNFWNN